MFPSLGNAAVSRLQVFTGSVPRQGILSASMQRSDHASRQSGSFVPLMLALIVLSAAIAVLSFLTLGFVGVILALAFALAAFIGLQYLLWGWWLGPLIQASEAARERERADSSDNPD